MTKMIDSSRGPWRYSPGVWHRGATGCIVERQASGPRQGIWKARAYGSTKAIQGAPDGTGWTTWQGYGSAQEARAAVDQCIEEERRQVAKALKAAAA